MFEGSNLGLSRPTVARLLKSIDRWTGLNVLSLTTRLSQNVQFAKNIAILSDPPSHDTAVFQIYDFM